MDFNQQITYRSYGDLLSWHMLVLQENQQHMAKCKKNGWKMQDGLSVMAGQRWHKIIKALEHIWKKPSNLAIDDLVNFNGLGWYETTQFKSAYR